MALDVHFLGTGGWFPSDQRETSCVMIPEIGVVFDAGTGFYRVRRNLKMPYLDIFISHLHDDHICGLPYSLGQFWRTCVKRVNVCGRKGIGKFLAHRQFCNPRFPLSLAQHKELTGIDFWTSDELFRDGIWRRYHEPYRISSDHPTRFDWWAEIMNTPHPSGGSLAFVLNIIEKETGVTSRVVYSVDTTFDFRNKKIKNFARLLREKEVALLIMECNFANRHEELARASGHSWPAVAIDFIKEVKPRRVALTHHHALAMEYDSGFMWEDQIAWEEVCKEIPHAILAEDQRVISL